MRPTCVRVRVGPTTVAWGLARRSPRPGSSCGMPRNALLVVRVRGDPVGYAAMNVLQTWPVIPMAG